jgi:glycerophosphoryl diester phosphodiesterase
MNIPALKLFASKHPLVIGHRGCCALAPENTLPSFRLALDAGADLIELDYHTSRDGVPVVIHDATLDRTSDARKKWKRSRVKVARKTAAEIQSLDAGGWFGENFSSAKIPLLTEALDFICDSGGVPLIEHKSGDADTLAKILRERNRINRVVVISFDWKFLREFHELVPGQLLGALGPPIRFADGKRPSRLSKRLDAKWLDELAKSGAKVVVWNRRVSKPAVQDTHRRGLKVWVYTIDEPKVAARLLDLGLDGIISNNPSAIRDVHR